MRARLLYPIALSVLLAIPSGSVAGQLPTGINGTVVVLNKGANSAHFIDLATGERRAELPTGQGPHELIITRDGRTAVGTDYGANSLKVFDVESATVTRSIDLGQYDSPHGIVFLPGDELVAVTSENQNAVVIVRIATGQIEQVIDTEARGSHMVAATADGQTLWTGDMNSNTVTELSRSTGAKVRALPAPARPEAINVNRSGTRVFAGSNATGRVSVFNTETGEATALAEGFGWPYRMFLTPDEDQLIVPDLEGEVLRFFDLNQMTELGSIAFPGEGPQGLVMYGDGRHLFLSLSAANRIAVVDIPNRRVVGYLPTGTRPDGIAWSSLRVGG